jgi:hypothetical protein
MWADISAELTILARAQQTVDRWRQSRHQVPIETELARSAHVFWDDRPESRNNREVFRLVALAIHRGEGHAFRDREPLLRITNRLLTPVREQ